MNRMTEAATMVAAALCLASAHAGGAAAQDRTFEWDGRLEAGQTLEVKGVTGPVVARPATGSSGSVRARIEGHGDDPSSVRIDVVEHDGGVTLCAVYPGEGNECERGGGGTMDVRDNEVEVRFEVRVPEGVRFAGRTVNGGVTARGLEGDVTAETVNGRIEVETTGTATAHTVNGSIDVRMGALAGPGPFRFRTVNGTIGVTLPEGVGARVEARTQNGGISTDFPLSVQGRFGSHSMEGAIGGGGPELVIETTNGTITLRRAG